MPRLLTGTFTTAAFVRSSFRQFGASPYRAAPKDLPSSFAQHGAIRAVRRQLLLRFVLPQQEMLPNFIDVVRWPDFAPLGFWYLFWHTGADLSRR